MRLGIMVRQFKEQLGDLQFASMFFEDRFSILVDAEWSTRKSKQLKSLIKNVGYAFPGASIENIEYLPDRKLDKSQILRLASCSYIQEAHNVILLGATHAGKTYLASPFRRGGQAQRRSERVCPLSRLTATALPKGEPGGNGSFGALRLLRMTGRMSRLASLTGTVRLFSAYPGGAAECCFLYLLFCPRQPCGADLILCQHTHCISCYEEYNGCHILYGQGNFHFVDWGSVPDSWNSMLAVQYDTASHEITFVPMVNTDLGIALAKGTEKEEIMRAFQYRNQELQNGQWKDGWHRFCLSVKETYLEAIGKACTPESTERDNDVFGHYLDCEAHTDVWRELFPTYNQTNEK